MNTMSKQDTPDKEKRSSWYWIAACALCGATAGYVGSDLFTGGANGEPLLDVTLSQVAALSVSFILVLCFIIVAIGFASPRLGMAMKMFEDIEQWEDERVMMWLSAIGGLAYTLALILLALAEPLGMAGSVPLLVVLGVLAVIFTYTAFRLLREYDELWHGVNSETCVHAFYLTLVVGGVWSALAHLEFVSPLAPLDWITLMTVASLVGAVISTQKRGMLED